MLKKIINKYSHLPDKLHGLFFQYAIERHFKTVGGSTAYKRLRWTSLWVVRLLAIAIFIGLSMFLFWLWFARLIVMSGGATNHQEGLDEAEGESQRNFMNEETVGGNKSARRKNKDMY